MQAQVSTQVWQPDRGVPTQATLVGCLVSACPLVPNESGGEAKDLAAGTTLVGPLPSVHDVVLDQVGAVAEGFATFGVP